MNLCKLSVLALAAGTMSASAARQSPLPAPAAPGNIRITVKNGGSQAAATIGDALLAARTLRRATPGLPVTILLPSGIFRLTAPIRLTAEDSGTPDAPLTIQGAADGSTTLSGASIVVATPTGDDVRLRIDPHLAGSVRKGYGYGLDSARPYALVFQGARRFELSSWPAHGYATDWDLRQSPAGVTAMVPGMPVTAGQHVIVAGYPSATWAFQAVPAVGTAPATLLVPYTPFSPILAHPKLRLLNIAGPLQQGRMRVAENGDIHVGPWRGGNPIEVATASSVIEFDGATDIVFQRVAIEKSAGSAIRASNASRIALRDCFVGLAGSFGIEVDGGTDVSIDRCVIASTALGGVRINGGDRPTLSAANHAVRDSIVSETGLDIRSTYPAIAMAGVGNVVDHSSVRSAPHTAISIDGNDHRVTDNEIDHVVCETDDAGAVYLGRDWTQRGNRIAGNFIHDLAVDSKAPAVAGIYLDDQFSGADIEGNTVLRAPHGIILGGGRDNIIRNNNFAGIANSAIIMDNRGQTVGAAMASEGGELRTRLARSPYRSELWRARYPALQNLLNDHPGWPVGNKATGNRVADGQWLWTQPLGLSLPGSDNSSVHMSPDQGSELATGTTAAQYRLIFSVLRHSTVSLPGPTKPLLYANRISTAATCAAP